MERSLQTAGSLAAALRGFRWDRLAPLRDNEATGGDGAREAARLLAALRSALVAEEFTSNLATELQVAENETFQWVIRYGGQRPGPDLTPGPSPGVEPDRGDPAPAGSVRRAPGQSFAQVLGELEHFLGEHADSTVEITWRVLP
ncbi:MAG: hypothetical protein ACRDTX_16315 [Pseudonocardiaceae bacterium]